jgi:DNA-directed RNA polymerase subunit M/transcription elongation factor TFIIS
MDFCPKCESLLDITSKNNVPNYICPSCKFMEPLKNNTLIYSNNVFKKFTNYDNITTGDIKQKIHCNVNVKTKNYDCINKDCPTHKNDSLKSATFERFDYQSYKVFYICNVCGAKWY